MALHFLLDEPTSAGVGDAVLLTGPEAHHAATVRRVRAGEEVTVGDGHGAWLTATVEEVSPREVSARVLARLDVPRPTTRIVLVQALAKGDRDELAVQAATELGVDEIVPWQAARSVSRWDAAKAAKGRARWASIAREAAKQSHRPWLPIVSKLASTADLKRRAAGSTAIVLEPTAVLRLTAARLAADDAREILLVVGPEGGISAEELTALAEAGGVGYRLGDTVLRTSTAGPAAIAVLSAMLERW